MKNVFKVSGVILFVLSIQFIHSCKKKEVPTLTTSAITSITGISAISGGTITDEGSGTIITRGVCWSTNITPTIADSKTQDGAGAGSFTSYITGLNGGTTYYVRAYATNSAGTAYGNEVSFITSSAVTTATDIDGNVYNAVTIGTQTWLKENLKTTKYNDDSAIPYITDDTQWSNLTTGAYCWCDNSESNKGTYGALYNWYAVNTEKLCPTGWHLPSDGEWTTMENYLIDNGYNYDGTVTGNKIAKTLATMTNWNSSSNTGAVGNTDYPGKRNVTGFSALPGSSRYSYGTFGSISFYGSWWSSSEYSSSNALYRFIHCDNSDLTSTDNYKVSGFSVRCIKDN
jgi:uncharacterized protein (TIGR02145 family)